MLENMITFFVALKSLELAFGLCCGGTLVAMVLIWFFIEFGQMILGDVMSWWRGVVKKMHKRFTRSR